MKSGNIGTIFNKKFIGTDELRKKLTSILSSFTAKRGEYIITQHGQPHAVIMDLKSYLKLQGSTADTEGTPAPDAISTPSSHDENQDVAQTGTIFTFRK